MLSCFGISILNKCPNHALYPSNAKYIYAGCNFFTRTGEGFPLMTSASWGLSIVSRIFETKIKVLQQSSVVLFVLSGKVSFDTQLPEFLVLSILYNPVNYLQ